MQDWASQTQVMQLSNARLGPRRLLTSLYYHLYLYLSLHMYL